MRLMRSFLWMSAGVITAVIFFGWQLSLRGGSFLHFGGMAFTVIGLLIIARQFVVLPLSSAVRNLANQLDELALRGHLKTSTPSDFDVVSVSATTLKSSNQRILELEAENIKLVEERSRPQSLTPSPSF